MPIELSTLFEKMIVGKQQMESHISTPDLATLQEMFLKFNNINAGYHALLLQYAKNDEILIISNREKLIFQIK